LERCKIQQLFVLLCRLPKGILIIRPEFLNELFIIENRLSTSRVARYLLPTISPLLVAARITCNEPRTMINRPRMRRVICQSFTHGSNIRNDT